MAGKGKRRNANARGKATRRGATTQMGLSSVLTRGPTDPQPVQYTIEHTYRTRLTVAPAGGTDVGVTMADLMASVPGGSTLWETARLDHISVFAPADVAGYVRVRMAEDTATVEPGQSLSDGKTFEDYGTQGSLRPVVHIRPALSLRQRWFVTTFSAAPLFFVNHGSSGQLLVYATLALRSVQRAV